MAGYPAPNTQVQTPASPEPVGAFTLADQYLLGDTGYDPNLDQPIQGQATSSPSPQKGEKAEQPAGVGGHETPPASNPLVELAKDFGLPESIAKTLTPEQITEFVRAQRAKETPNPSPASQDAKGKAPQGQDAPPAEEEFSWELQEDNYDPDLLRAVKGSLSKLHKRNLALEKKLAAYEQQEQVRQVGTVVEQIDGAFNELPQQYQTFFGKGGRDAIKEDSVELAMRRAACALAEKDQSQGSIKDKITRAAKSLVSRMVPEAEGGGPARDALGRFVSPELAARQKSWQDAGLARPTQRNGSAEPPGEAKALQTVARILTDQGPGETDMEGFL